MMPQQKLLLRSSQILIRLVLDHPGLLKGHRSLGAVAICRLRSVVGDLDIAFVVTLVVDVWLDQQKRKVAAAINGELEGLASNSR